MWAKRLIPNSTNHYSPATQQTFQKYSPLPSENASPYGVRTGKPQFTLDQLTTVAYWAMKGTKTDEKGISSTATSDESNQESDYTLKKYKEAVYLGQLKQGRRHGFGILLYLTGRQYKGFWDNNLREGKGCEIFESGQKYEGSFKKGKPDGCGKYQTPNGEFYEGQWKEGLKHGSGMWRGARGDSYIGEWRSGKVNGYGVHTWENGDRYEGQFQDCLKHGEGIDRFANGDVYKGSYENGKPTGLGEYFWASGSSFKGEFRDGLRHGKGIWKKSQSLTADEYEGDFVDDKKAGEGIYKWEEGHVYRGHFEDDTQNGYGEVVWADGSTYQGIWVNGSPAQSRPVIKEDYYTQESEGLCELQNPESAPIIVTTGGQFIMTESSANFCDTGRSAPIGFSQRGFRSKQQPLTKKNSQGPKLFTRSPYLVGNEHNFEGPFQNIIRARKPPVPSRKTHMSRVSAYSQVPKRAQSNSANQISSNNSFIFYKNPPRAKSSHGISNRPQLNQQQYHPVSSEGLRKNKFYPQSQSTQNNARPMLAHSRAASHFHDFQF